LHLSLFEISSCTNSRLSRQILEIVSYTKTRSKAPFEKINRKKEKDRKKEREREREREKQRKCPGVNAPQPTSPGGRLEAQVQESLAGLPFYSSRCKRAHSHTPRAPYHIH